MRYRTLGRTGLSVSEVGLGGGGSGGVWGATTDKEVEASVHTAIDLGINFFDTAPGYGTGTGETRLGNALRGKRDEVVITTKVAIETHHFVLDGDRIELPDLASFVEDQLHASLRRLQTDRVDVLMVHNGISSRRGRPLLGQLTAEDALAMAHEFEKHRAHGKVRFLGFTAWRATDTELDKLLASNVFDVLQAEYNLLNQSATQAPVPGQDVTGYRQLEDQDTGPSFRRYWYRPVDQLRVMSRAGELDIGVMCIRAVMAGLLTSGLDRPIERGSAMPEMLRRVHALRFLWTSTGRTISQAAIAFCLLEPAISSVIIGAKNAAEVEDMVAALDVPPFTEDELRRVQDLYIRDFRRRAAPASVLAS